MSREDCVMRDREKERDVHRQNERRSWRSFTVAVYVLTLKGKGASPFDLPTEPVSHLTEAP
jgi:hypothetical protein